MNPQAELSTESFVSLVNKFKLDDIANEISSLLFACVHSGVTSKSPVRICEVGCGFGRLYPGIIGQGCIDFDYVGIDISKESLNLFREKHPRAKIHNADICTDDFSSLGMFDVVYVPFTLLQMFSFDAQKKVLEGMLPLLEKGGILIADTINPRTQCGKNESTVIDISVPKEDGGIWQSKAYLGSREMYQEVAEDLQLKVIDRIRYNFAGQSRHEYLVFKKITPQGSDFVSNEHQRKGVVSSCFAGVTL